jgi:hypothetical protein
MCATGEGRGRGRRASGLVAIVAFAVWASAGAGLSSAASPRLPYPFSQLCVLIPPEASFTYHYEPYKPFPETGQAIRFDPSGSKPGALGAILYYEYYVTECQEAPNPPLRVLISSYSWSWGDGTPDATDREASHAYSSPGQYRVTLTITATYTGADSESALVTVRADPPNTTITKGVPRKTDRHTATFRFKGNERGSSFRCKLDKGRWNACESPRKIKGLKRGKHKFQVRAIDAAGNKDPSPAKDKFRVVRPPR